MCLPRGRRLQRSVLQDAGHTYWTPFALLVRNGAAIPVPRARRRVQRNCARSKTSRAQSGHSVSMDYPVTDEPAPYVLAGSADRRVQGHTSTVPFFISKGSRVMPKSRLAAIIGLVATTTFGLSGVATAAAPNSCFRVSDWNGWTVTRDARSMYVRVGMRSLYRIDFVDSCRVAQDPGVHIVTRVRGSGLVCSAIDLDLKFAVHRGFATACLVDKITPLSAAEAAALPKTLRP